MNNKHFLETSINLIRKKLPDIKVVREVKSGKEATLYKVISGDKVYALKVYTTNRNLSSRDIYTSGKFIREKSIRRAIGKKNRFGKEVVRRNWVRREFYMLKKMHDMGANVPKVFMNTDNAILMEFIGNDEPAPRLSDMKISLQLAEIFLQEITNSIKIFFQNGIVHSDLSAYNILVWNDKPYIIDFPQAADISKNPNAMELLKRDIDNIAKYFKVESSIIYENLTSTLHSVS